jgi:septum formation protein
MTIILASGSPRRKELLKGLDIEFLVETISVEENYPSSLNVNEVALYLAGLKAKGHQYLLEKYENPIVITADTVVILENEILGKPQNEDEGVAMIERLAGKKHRVTTGVCIITPNQQICFDQSTDVWFRNLEKSEIAYYIKNYKPMDKAGSYGIQEWIGYTAIEKMEGCFYNVMGLPVMRVYLELKKLGFDELLQVRK